MNENISQLFWRLIKQTPALIKDRELFYNLDGEVIRIWWTCKTEDNVKSSSCHEYDKKAFTRETPVSSFIYWEFDNSKQLDGYTFYIDTPICQFKVPELSRQELVDAQNLIYKHFKVFIPNYLDNLLNSPQYGKVKVEKPYPSVIVD